MELVLKKDCWMCNERDALYPGEAPKPEKQYLAELEKVKRKFLRSPFNKPSRYMPCPECDGKGWNLTNEGKVIKEFIQQNFYVLSREGYRLEIEYNP